MSLVGQKRSSRSRNPTSVLPTTTDMRLTCNPSAPPARRRRCGKIRSYVITFLDAGLAGELGFDVAQADVIRPPIGTDPGLMAAPIVLAVD
jgi:hypothetical protein